MIILKFRIKNNFRFDNGDVYEGGWANNKPHGQGVMLYLYLFLITCQV